MLLKRHPRGRMETPHRIAWLSRIVLLVLLAAYFFAGKRGESIPIANPPVQNALPHQVSSHEELAEHDQAQLKDLLSLIRDGTLKMGANEMPAYWQLVSLAEHLSPETLRSEATSPVPFNSLYQSPSGYRGKVMNLELNVRRVMRYPVTSPNDASVKEIFEVWGWTNQARAWMYVVLTPQLPPEIPVGEFVQRKANFTGYFFKLQGYQPGDAKPNAPPLVAPLFIGQFTSVPSASPPSSSAASDYSSFVVIVIGVIIVSIMAWRTYKPRHPPTSSPLAHANIDALLGGDQASDISPPTPFRTEQDSSRLGNSPS